MNPRTRILLIVMAVIGFVWAADAGYRNFIEGPAEDRVRQIAKLDQQINEARDLIIQSAQAPDTLDRLERLSLPYDPELARAGYQDWLLDLVQQCELTSTSVDAGNPATVTIKDAQTGKQKEIYLRYGFSIRGRGNLLQIVDFLYRFYQGGHLHKITALNMNPVSRGRLLDFSASIEAIGLTRCERKGDLSRETGFRLASKRLQDYNPFPDAICLRVTVTRRSQRWSSPQSPFQRKGPRKFGFRGRVVTPKSAHAAVFSISKHIPLK